MADENTREPELAAAVSDVVGRIQGNIGAVNDIQEKVANVLEQVAAKLKNDTTPIPEDIRKLLDELKSKNDNATIIHQSNKIISGLIESLKAFIAPPRSGEEIGVGTDVTGTELGTATPTELGTATPTESATSTPTEPATGNDTGVMSAQEGIQGDDDRSKIINEINGVIQQLHAQTSLNKQLSTNVSSFASAAFGTTFSAQPRFLDSLSRMSEHYRIMKEINKDSEYSGFMKMREVIDDLKDKKQAETDLIDKIV
jgi:hypothetical protein